MEFSLFSNLIPVWNIRKDKSWNKILNDNKIRYFFAVKFYVRYNGERNEHELEPRISWLNKEHDDGEW